MFANEKINNTTNNESWVCFTGWQRLTPVPMFPLCPLAMQYRVGYPTFKVNICPWVWGHERQPRPPALTLTLSLALGKVCNPSLSIFYRNSIYSPIS